MVHTLFAWCYGGNQVSLCGSFNGWTEHMPMILVEGSSTNFQTIHDLPPGYHQFKFFVDGVWRVDERLLCSEDEYGINNVILVKEPELIISPRFQAEAGQPVMDIDGFEPHNVASTSGGLRHEPVLLLSANEIDISRHRLSMLMSFYKTYELIPNSGVCIGC